MSEMLVSIISETERLPHRYGGTTFYYRRITSKKNREFINEATERGELNTEKLGDLILRWCIVGWDDLSDGQGGLVPGISGLDEVALSARFEITQQIPDSALLEVASKFREALPDKSALGN